MFFTIKKDLAYVYAAYPKMRAPFRAYLWSLLICAAVGGCALGYSVFFDARVMHPFMRAFSMVGMAASVLAIFYSVYALLMFSDRHKVVD